MADLPCRSSLRPARRCARPPLAGNVSEEGEDVEEVEDTAEAVLTVAVA
jgi:hypothetical protein